MDKLYDELLVELECPICTNYMSPPIRQCSTGHSVCETCRTKLPKCPLCQGDFTDSKNLTLEALACKMRYPCINKSSGCPASLAYDEREEHERNCTYKGFKCAMENCPWVGKLAELQDHWDSKKMTSKPFQATNVCHTKIKTDSYYANMIQAYDSLFWFKCKITNGQIYWAVQYIGDKSDADDYYYEIEIFKPGHPKRRTLLSEYCQSIDLQNSEMFKAGICLYTTTEAISQYVGDDQLLIYYMRVYELEEKDIPEGHHKKHLRRRRHHKHRDHSKGPHGHDHKDKDKHKDKKGDYKDKKDDESKHKFKKNPHHKKDKKHDDK